MRGGWSVTATVRGAHRTGLHDLADRYPGTIDIETVGAMVRIALTHDELTEEMSQRIRYGWPLVLSSLKSFLETGEPLDILGTGTACSAASSSAASSTKPSRAAA